MKKLLAVLFLFLFPSIAFGAVGPLVNASPLTITAGGTWQQLFAAASGNRSTIWIQNPCTTTSQGIGTTESIYVSFSTLAPSGVTSGGVFELAACGSLVMTGPYISQQKVWVYGATTSHAFAAAASQ